MIENIKVGRPNFQEMAKWIFFSLIHSYSKGIQRGWHHCLSGLSHLLPVNGYYFFKEWWILSNWATTTQIVYEPSENTILCSLYYMTDQVCTIKYYFAGSCWPRWPWKGRPWTKQNYRKCWSPFCMWSCGNCKNLNCCI